MPKSRLKAFPPEQRDVIEHLSSPERFDQEQWRFHVYLVEALSSDRNRVRRNVVLGTALNGAAAAQGVDPQVPQAVVNTYRAYENVPGVTTRVITGNDAVSTAETLKRSKWFPRAACVYGTQLLHWIPNGRDMEAVINRSPLAIDPSVVSFMDTVKTDVNQRLAIAMGRSPASTVVTPHQPLAAFDNVVHVQDKGNVLVFQPQGTNSRELDALLEGVIEKTVKHLEPASRQVLFQGAHLRSLAAPGRAEVIFDIGVDKGTTLSGIVQKQNPGLITYTFGSTGDRRAVHALAAANESGVDIFLAVMCAPPAAGAQHKDIPRQLRESANIAFLSHNDMARFYAGALQRAAQVAPEIPGLTHAAAQLGSLNVGNSGSDLGGR